LGNWLKIGVLVAICLIPLFTVPVFAQQWGLYSNELYDFSFEAPLDWRYQEDLVIDAENTFQVVMYPEEFSLENVDESSAGLMDLQFAMMGFGFQLESPLIGVSFENISTSDVPSLNENNLKEYVLDALRTYLPNARILDSYVESKPWGWEVSILYTFVFPSGLGSGFPYVAHDITFFFKDREAYTLSYGAHEDYFDQYRPVHDHVLDTLVIKSVNVPEFQEIAMVVLAGSIVLVVVFARKFKVMKILNS